LNVIKSALFAATLVSTGAHATESIVTTAELLNVASGALKVDGINKGRAVKIMESPTPFVFTYCQEGSTSLRRHEVISTEAPDAAVSSVRVTKDMEIEANSPACKIAG
jgi:hypothetical protein